MHGSLLGRPTVHSCTPMSGFRRYEPSPVLFPGGPKSVWKAAEGLKGCVGQSWDAVVQGSTDGWLIQTGLCICLGFPSKTSVLIGIASAQCLRRLCGARSLSWVIPDHGSQQIYSTSVSLGTQATGRVKDDRKLDSNVCNGGLGCGGC